MGRLRKLEQLQLARERQTGVWQLASDLEATPKAFGMRGDIIKILHRSLKEAGIDRAAGGFALFDPSKSSGRMVSRVAGIGLTDEINDRHYVIIDATDGKVHYADVGYLPPELVPERNMITAIEARSGSEDQKSRTRLRILSYP
jgi:type IV secretory pathway VirD2 relaxase